MKKSILVLFLFSTLGLAGCGQTGPLYMPEDAAAQQSQDPQ